jgi:hypothetical protein
VTAIAQEDEEIELSPKREAAILEAISSSSGRGIDWREVPRRIEKLLTGMARLHRAPSA